MGSGQSYVHVSSGGAYYGAYGKGTGLTSRRPHHVVWKVSA